MQSSDLAIYPIGAAESSARLRVQGLREASRHGSSAILRGTAAHLLVCGPCAGDLDDLVAALPHPADRSAARRAEQSEVSRDMIGSSPVQTLIILASSLA